MSGEQEGVRCTCGLIERWSTAPTRQGVIRDWNPHCSEHGLPPIVMVPTRVSP